MPTSKTKTAFFKKVAITTGDPTGIGFEVSVKALTHLRLSLLRQPVLFFIFRDHKQPSRQKKIFTEFDRHFTRLAFTNLGLALDFVSHLKPQDFSKKIVIDLSLSTSAADWVFEATRLCRDKVFDSLVTGPLSKTLIKKSGYSQIGHTGIFKSFFPKSPLRMAFVGQDFNVVLATDHLPLSEVGPALSSKNFQSTLRLTQNLKTSLGLRKKIAVLGLNPHAGEKGLIGKTELTLFKKLPAGFEGPLVPDAAFLKKNWSKYSAFICLYHDQGLIPFKMHHGQDSGAHLTLGLPFVRTSVDHGTAFDLYNKNSANFHSMLDAIYLNLKLLDVIKVVKNV